MNAATVIGGGAYGTALASMLAGKQGRAMLWAREADVAEDINAHHRNRIFLPDVPLPGTLHATTSFDEALEGAELVVLASPSHAMRSVAEDVAARVKGRPLIVCAAKGIETDSLDLMSDVLRSVFSRDARLSYLSGPSFARELAMNLPTSVVIASQSEADAIEVQHLISTPTFRAYTTTDVVGVEVGGSLKNVYAIAAGASEGLGLGDNARAALITRGLNEMVRLGSVLGAEPLTFAGLAGIGDLVLTCTGNLSRNHAVGVALGRGESPEAVLGGHRVAEGVNTAKAAYQMSRKYGLDLPIIEQVYRVLHEGKKVVDALRELMSRDLKPEWSVG